ncbi:Hypothetical protein SRAE_X000249100 [Strongyloides ratti]|uniref:Uncharacterized protein n=1 Tax=Strongyloides ratti TaxID=34506 RepID=A0A090KTI0_STRRB|nr:Hypothetical protein SRAE_X000249100 [Strongyloides ratti]CEF60815.1 Hypothetical protein SRAE_X000249100 [Strongyloides ratti]
MECYFNVQHLSSFENGTRQLCASMVSIDCQKRNNKLHSLQKIETIAKVNDLFGAHNKVDLLMQRDEGNFDID